MSFVDSKEVDAAREGSVAAVVSSLIPALNGYDVAVDAAISAQHALSTRLNEISEALSHLIASEASASSTSSSASSTSTESSADSAPVSIEAFSARIEDLRARAVAVERGMTAISARVEGIQRAISAHEEGRVFIKKSQRSNSTATTSDILSASLSSLVER